MQDSAFIGRQPVLNQQQKIIGYELFFRDHPDAVSTNALHGLEEDTRVLVNTLSNMGTAWLLADKFAFINVSKAMLESDFLDLLPVEQAVLEVHVAPGAQNEIRSCLEQAKKRNFKVSLDDFEWTEDSKPLLEFADYVKFDVHALDVKALKKMVEALRPYRVQIVAKKVEDHDDFKNAEVAGIKLFQGYYFARPVTLSAKVINPAYVNIVSLLKMVRENADVHEIEKALKRDVALSFKLLRFINSTGFGLSCEIQSFRHAVTILGYEKLSRWLSLLLATADKDAGPPALMKTAVTRGRLAELMGQNYFEQSEDRDNLFIVGVFSLLDVMLEMPMEQVLESLFLPESVNDALLLRQGVYGPFLDLAEACENPKFPHMKDLAELLQLNPQKVNQAHLAALAWVEELGI